MAVTLPEVQVGTELTNKGLVSDQLWKRLVNRIVEDENMERPLAERIMDQALGFLRLCALEPAGRYSPSPLVDIGWHTFILYTRPYAAFCQEIAGHFIHHNPSDEEGVDYGTGNIARTVAALQARGLVVDEMLWTGPAKCNDGCSYKCKGEAPIKATTVAADCSSYCSGDSCSGGGGDGDPGCSH